MPIKKYDAIIIGAGISGLAAANYLKNYKILVLEANDYVGGRIKTVKIGDNYYDTGANYIHGKKKNKIFDLFKKEKWELKRLKRTLYYDPIIFDKNIYTKKEIIDKDCKVKEIFQLYKDLIKNNHKFGNLDTLKDYYVMKNIDPKYFPLISSIWTYDLGCSMENINLNEFIHQKRNWNHGSSDYRPVNTLSRVTEHYNNGNIKLNSKVVVIDSSNFEEKGIRVKLDTGEFIRTKTIILSVSLPAINKIKFEPKLNSNKLSAIKNIRNNPITSINIIFDKRPWKEKYQDCFILCGNCYFQEINLYEKEDKFICFGLSVDDKAKLLLNKTDEEILDEILNQLKDMKLFKENHQNISGYHVENWSKNNNIELGYTSPSPLFNDKSSKENKNILSENHGNIFFCGEATNYDVCIHTCLTKGKKIAKDAIKKIN